MLIDSFRVEEILHSLGLWPHFPWMPLEVLHPVENHTTWCDLGNMWACIVLSGKSQVLIRSEPDDLVVSSWSFGFNLFASRQHVLTISKASLCQPHSWILSQSVFPPSHNPFTISIPGPFCLTTSLLPAPMCIGLKKCWWLNILCMPCKFMCYKPIRDGRQEMW